MNKDILLFLILSPFFILGIGIVICILKSSEIVYGQ